MTRWQSFSQPGSGTLMGWRLGLACLSDLCVCAHCVQDQYTNMTPEEQQACVLAWEQYYANQTAGYAFDPSQQQDAGYGFDPQQQQQQIQMQNAGGQQAWGAVQPQQSYMQVRKSHMVPRHTELDTCC